jgi:predicted  nucleic acid-binding Zn-ribbon protein
VEVLDATKTKFDLRKADLDAKKAELDEIIAETKKEEDALQAKSDTAKKNIEERLLVAYTRLRTNAKNGLAVVPVDRDSCGGCFNKIPPQRQLDIQSKRKIIVCEHCGRVLVPSQD